MANDEPSLTEIVEGVRDRQDATDIGLIAAVCLLMAGWGWYQGNTTWWVLPIIFVGIAFSVDATFWYYYDYRAQVLKNKTERLADGEDVEPEIDTGPGITSPYGITILSSIAGWWTVTNYLIQPIVENATSAIIFMSGMFILITGITLYFDRTGRLD